MLERNQNMEDHAKLMTSKRKCCETSASTTSIRTPLIDRYTNSWWPEIAALYLSSACTIAITAVLGAFSGKPNLSLAYGLTLNAITSVSASTSKVSLIFAISNALGQSKWIWFSGQSSRQLSDAEIFDNASRGPLGAAKMLAAHTRRSIGSFGALLILLALAYDPFVQQIIAYEAVEVPVDTNEAYMYQAQCPDFQATLDTDKSYVQLNSAINVGRWYSQFDLTPVCPTGNCTWADFKTIGWCGECHQNTKWYLSSECYLGFDWEKARDAAAQLGLDLNTLQVDENVAFSNNCSIRSRVDDSAIPSTIDFVLEGYGTPNEVMVTILYNSTLSATTNSTELIYASLYGDNITYRDLGDAPIHEVGFFAMQPEVNTTGALSLYGMICSLDLCVQSYQLDVQNGIVRSEIQHSEGLTKSLQTGTSESMPVSDAYHCFEDSNNDPFKLVSQEGFLLDTDEDGNRYGVAMSDKYDFTWCDYTGSLEYVAPLLFRDTWNLQPQFVSNGYSGDVPDPGTNATWLRTTGGPDTPLSLKQTIFSWLNMSPSDMIRNTATSLTKYMLDPTNNLNGTRKVTARMNIAQTYVKVRWIWLTLPVVLCLSGIVFLVLTILSIRRHDTPLWKSSINALIYHASDHSAAVTSSLETIPEMDRQAASTRSRLSLCRVNERRNLETSIVGGIELTPSKNRQSLSDNQMFPC